MAGTGPAMTAFQSAHSRTCECIPIPALPGALMIVASCSVRGASRGHSEVGQSESWPEGQPDGRCGACGRGLQPRTREALGEPTGPTTGLCLEWLDGAGARGRKPSGSWRKPLLVPEARPQGQKSPRRDVERRCRVPLFPGDPGNKPRPLPRCAFRRPVTPHLGVRPKQASGSRESRECGRLAV
jgi:hypothetical protein